VSLQRKVVTDRTDPQNIQNVSANVNALYADIRMSSHMLVRK